MISKTDLSGKFAFDNKGLDQLRTAARQDSPEALKGTAQQFEALFLNMVMKSMREATPHEGPFSSEQEKMLTGMLDQQLSQNLAKKGIGLADTLVLQLSKQMQAHAPGTATVSDKGLPLTRADARSEGLSLKPKDGLSLQRSDSLSVNKPDALQAYASVNAKGASATPSSVAAAGAASATPSTTPSTTISQTAGAVDPATVATPATGSINPLTGADATGRIAKFQALANELAANPNFRPFAPGRLGNSAAAYLDNKNLDALAGNDASRGVADDYEALVSNLSGKRSQPDHVRAFQEKLTRHAEQASRETGIPAKFMLGQAALESGWGKREITTADGTKSHNLFGIKATPGWKGKTAEAVTTEFVNGVAYTKREKFRVYDSYAEGFRDYAKLLSNNPRYGNVISQAQDATSFAKGLQRAGYATDPHYATKLTRIINHSLI